MKRLNEEILKRLENKPKIYKTITYSRIGLSFYDDNAVMFSLDRNDIDWFHACGRSQNVLISTKTASRKDIKEEIIDDKCLVTVSYRQDHHILKQHFEIEKDKPYFTTWITLSSDKEISSNLLAPLDFIYPSDTGNKLFLSLDEKMLCIPYDNDMWTYYDTTTLRPGRTSYDVSAIYDAKTLNGLVIGALDFDTFKNVIRCSAYDARSFAAISGVADENTHDHLEHGFIQGKEVSSSRFICGYYKDIRDGLEEYGELVKHNNIFHWDHGVPFGWNSYSALTLTTNIDHVKTAADLIYHRLPDFRSQDGVTYINFDAVFGISKKEIRKLIKELHQRKQKVGWYMNPLSHLAIQDYIPLRGSKLKFRKDILMHNQDGSLYPPIDNKYPIDITIPEAEQDFRLALREFVKMGFDYLKVDFLSHGAVEGIRYNKAIKTGRQALIYFFDIIKEELDPEKIGREIFLSSSIAPLFPCGYFHSRRASCDAFGHHEDVKYVLNALNYGWWTNNTLYQFNDPDHTVLYRSLVDGRTATSEEEARSRYNASVISGTVLLLSDNYGIKGDQETIENSIKRALKFAVNKEINKIARLNKAFRPLTMYDTSNVYYLNDEDDYLAVFNFDDQNIEIEIDPQKINLKKKGKIRNLNNSKTLTYEKKIFIKLKPYDSFIFKAIKK
ncbi:MAG: hypothetical protein IKF80_11220 [Erysipelotrichaceae bacterium]|nr:hypothetical protein [Erysipelotrichaceae bacterium]